MSGALGTDFMAFNPELGPCGCKLPDTRRRKGKFTWRNDRHETRGFAAPTDKPVFWGLCAV